MIPLISATSARYGSVAKVNAYMTPDSKTELLHDAADIAATVTRLADDIAEAAGAAGDIAVVGIRTRGYTLAQRLQPLLEARIGRAFHFGSLDITLYRDDLSTLGSQPVVGTTDLPFEVDGCTVFLIDDVVYTGRTTRAALEALLAFGRPAAIRLVTLVDRGHREYPIQPDITGYGIPTKKNQIVQVQLSEVDNSEGIYLATR